LKGENSCDDYVLQFQYNAADYAKALLAIEQHSVESILALGSNSQNEFQLLTRIKRMLAPERQGIQLSPAAWPFISHHIAWPWLYSDLSKTTITNHC
jgi:hypothetical protein